MRAWGAAAAIAALGLSGCMGSQMYASRAVEQNLAIGEAADKILLLNIVRARFDRPVVYSQFDGVSEAFELNPGVSLGFPFGADAASFYSAELSAGPNQFTSLSTSPLNDQEFYQGVMRPIQVGLIRYYLDNGWPRDLLLSLTVEKLNIGAAFYDRVVLDSDAACAGSSSAACQRIADPSRVHSPPPNEGGRRYFVNDPRNPALFDPFHELVLRLIVLGLTVDGQYVTETFQFPEGSAFGASSAEIRRLIDMGATLRSKGDVYELTLKTWKPSLRLPRLTGSNVRVAGEVPGPDNIDMLASLRSPDSILFYIGAYTRGGADADVLVGDRFVPVFEIGDCADAVVEVDFDGGCYGVPRGSTVSMKVMGFLHQVIGLNQRAAEGPSPAILKTTD